MAKSTGSLIQDRKHIPQVAETTGHVPGVRKTGPTNSGTNTPQKGMSMMDVQVVAIVVILAVILTAAVTWQIAKRKHKTLPIGDIFVDWTDPQNIEFYLALDHEPDKSIKDHDIVFMRVHQISQ